MTIQMLPEGIHIQTINRCSGRCTFCPYLTYISGQQRTEMSDETWNHVLTMAERSGYTGVIGPYLHMEPFCDTKLADRIAEINRRLPNVQVVMSTNAAGLTITWLDILLALKCRVRALHVNMPTAAPAVYRRVTGLDFHDVQRNLQMLEMHPWADYIDHLVMNIIQLPDVEYNPLAVKSAFGGFKLNAGFSSTSRGGLIPSAASQGGWSPFTKNRDYCTQPETNICIAADGSVLLCCMDWRHVTARQFMHVTQYPDLFILYDRYRHYQTAFKTRHDYSNSDMCMTCAKELGFPISLED